MMRVIDARPALAGLTVALCAAIMPASAQAAQAARPHADDAQDLRALVAGQAALLSAQQRELDELRARLAAVEAAAAPPRAAQTAALAPAAAEAGKGSAAPPANAPGALVGTRVDWKTGVPNFSADDGSFSFRPRGRIQTEISSTRGASNDASNVTATEFRRMRLGFQGTVGRSTSYVMEGDFADNKVQVTAAYLAQKYARWDTDIQLALGYMRMERGMDGASNDLYTPFMERSAIYEGLMNTAGSLAMGLQGSITGSNWRINANLVGDGLSDGEQNDNVALVLRGHWNPLKRDGVITHVGASGYTESVSGTRDLALSMRLAGHANDQVLVRSGITPGVSRSQNVNLELGQIYHSAWIMGEHGWRDLHGSQGDVTHRATSVGAGWMFNGADVPYAPREGQWSAMNVRNPVGSGGRGEFGVAARWDKLDYGDSPLGGVSNTTTLGVNWYMTRQLTAMLNLIHWNLHDGGGLPKESGDTLAARLQFYF